MSRLLANSYLIVVIILFIKTTLILSQENSCNSFEDYFNHENNPNCFYNEDMRSNPPSLIRKYMVEPEVHKVIGDDGYILTLFRIPQKNPKAVIFLAHCYLADSLIFLFAGNQSWAYYLWRQGYEVWLNNNRGTRYSSKHINMSINDPKYWDFSVDEPAINDLHPQIKYIKQITRVDKLIYIGFSYGTTIGSIYAIHKAEEVKDFIKVFIFVGPASLFTNNENPAAKIVRLNLAQKLINQLNGDSIIAMIPSVLSFLSVLFRQFPLGLYLTHIVLWLLCGWTPDQTNPALLNFDADSLVQRISWKSFLHFAQLVNMRNKFQQFDYGLELNRVNYGTDKPREYRFDNITVPIYLISSQDDILTPMADANEIFKRLPDRAKIYGQLQLKGLNHADFVIGKDFKAIFFDKLLDFLDNVSN